MKIHRKLIESTVLGNVQTYFMSSSDCKFTNSASFPFGSKTFVKVNLNCYYIIGLSLSLYDLV